MLRQGLLGLALASLAHTAVAADSDDPPEFRTAKVAIQQQMRSKKTDDRVAAMRRLGEFPVIDAAKLALQVAAPRTPRPKSATRPMRRRSDLRKRAGRQIPARLARQANAPQARPETAAPLLGCIALVEERACRADAMALLDKMVETTPNSRMVAVELADRLAAGATDEDVALLVKLSKTKTFTNQFGFRRSVIWALSKIDSLPAIGALIGMLGDIDGEAQADAIKYLTSVTDQALGNNSRLGPSGGRRIVRRSKSRRSPASLATAATKCRPA